MSAARPTPKPWPMKWVVLVIVICLGAYTFLTLRYRKQSPTFEPYEDMKTRANTVRLLSAGFQRIAVTAQRPADPTSVPGGAAIAEAGGGLPGVLRDSLIDLPTLPADYTRIAAAPRANPLLPYSIQFTCSVGDHHQQLAGAHVYVREDQVYIVPEFEKLSGELLARSRDSVVLLTVPPGVLKPGRYQVSLLGARASRTWALQVH